MVKYWIQLAIGFWIMLSPWFLGFAEISLAKWSNVLVGLALIVWGAWEIFNEPKSELPPEQNRAKK